MYYLGARYYAEHFASITSLNPNSNLQSWFCYHPYVIDENCHLEKLVLLTYGHTSKVSELEMKLRALWWSAHSLNNDEE